MVRHPAKFSDDILTVIRGELPRVKCKVLDPFAGTSKIKSIDYVWLSVYTNEIEPEWAKSGYRCDTIADALSLPYASESFDVICTSPTYGNRLADHHDAKDSSHRITYTHYLGRKLDKRNSGSMQWSRFYREFHRKAWLESNRVLKYGGLFILNISDHIRKGELVPVSGWHLGTILTMGYSFIRNIKVITPRLRYGENSQTRVGHENVYVLRKDSKVVY